ncbi:hypothetical protein GGR07_001421 [Bacteroides pyogenes]|nr:hypothetical protein [Bacteroides pyogenes]SUV32093.1 Uncharacterised protein [Bacteroides pyogenes]
MFYKTLLINPDRDDKAPNFTVYLIRFILSRF